MKLSLIPDTDKKLKSDLLAVAEAHYERKEWRSRIRAAMRPECGNERLVVEYEPMHGINLASSHRQISEALVRLHSDGVLISPGAFLPAVRGNTNMSRALDRWVLTEVVTELAANPEQTIAVNLSAASVVDSDLPAFLVCLLSLSRVQAKQLIFEVTEHESFDLESARQVLGVLVQMGCQVALDDFAQGASGLHLLSLPIAWLKIDGSLIRLIHQPEYQEIVADVMTLARRRGLRLVAEWIEIPEQEEIVESLARSVGAECWGQGWLYS